MTARSWRIGAAGEARVAAWYEAAGYHVLARNWRVREGELDLVVRRGSVVAFCEVKTRSSSAFGTAAEAVTVSKQRRIRGLALAWLRETGERAGELRFDVAAVTPQGVDVIEAAF